jgi:regulator of PEP synthase PpsR (kinase-PPPase family)
MATNPPVVPSNMDSNFIELRNVREVIREINYQLASKKMGEERYNTIDQIVESLYLIIYKKINTGSCQWVNELNQDTLDMLKYYIKGVVSTLFIQSLMSIQKIERMDPKYTLVINIIDTFEIQPPVEQEVTGGFISKRRKGRKNKRTAKRR